jgi:hypothetical protein
LKHFDGRTTTVPVPSREELDRGSIDKIVMDIGVHAEELVFVVGRSMSLSMDDFMQTDYER